MITQISTDDLRKMKGSEGLIIQGCGGDLNQWVDGINDLLAKLCVASSWTALRY